MAVELAQQIWQELRRHIPAVDVSEAADSMITVLIDNDYTAQEIYQGFKGDDDVRQSLETYMDDMDDMDDFDEEETDQDLYEEDEDSY